MTWKNPADTAKTAVITDKLPEGVKFVSADQEGVYSEADHTVTWNVITDAHTEGTVTVKVKVLASAAGTELNNQARVGMDEADITTVTDNGGDLFRFHEAPNPDCPVGRNIHALLDDKLKAIQNAMEAEMKKYTLLDLRTGMKELLALED